MANVKAARSRSGGVKITRRQVLRMGGGLGIAGLTGLSALRTPASAAPTTNLIFIAGSYEPQLMRDGLDRFEKQYPGMKVDYVVEPSLTYVQKMVTILSTGARQVDLCHVSDEQLGSWAEAGWLEPLDGRIELAGYKKDMYPEIFEGLTYKGRVWGLPYYADFQILVYNEKLWRQAGLSTPPATWDEVKNQLIEIKKATKIEYPMVTAALKGTINAFALHWSMVYAAGGAMFDKQLNPVYPDKDPAALQALEWLVEAVNNWKILDPKSLELYVRGVTDALAAGQAAFGDVAKYELLRLNDPTLSKIPGEAKMALFPTFSKGQRGGSYGWMRLYSITKKGRHKDEAWKLLQYEGGKDREGKYYRPKLWYLQRGLGFAYPQLTNDPEVIESTKKWGDIELLKRQAALAKTKENIKAQWYGEWDVYHGGQLQDAILKKISPRDALLASAKKAEALKKEWQ